MSRRVSVQEFAKLHGVSANSVYKWRQRGWISFVSGKKGVEPIDVDQANAQLAKHRSPSPPADEGAEAAKVETIAEAKLRYELARARMEELKVQEKEGDLVLRAAVVAAWSEAGAALRDTLLGITPEVKELFAVETNPDVIGARLDEELFRALEALANGFGASPSEEG